MKRGRDGDRKGAAESQPESCSPSRLASRTTPRTSHLSGTRVAEACGRRSTPTHQPDFHYLRPGTHIAIPGPRCQTPTHPAQRAHICPGGRNQRRQTTAKQHPGHPIKQSQHSAWRPRDPDRPAASASHLAHRTGPGWGSRPPPGPGLGSTAGTPANLLAAPHLRPRPHGLPAPPPPWPRPPRAAPPRPRPHLPSFR